MRLFSKNKKTGTELIQLHNTLTNSFKNVRKDTSNIFQWLDYLYKRNLYQEQLIRNFKEELQYMPKSKEDIKRIIDESYSYEIISNRIKEIDNKIEDLRKDHLQLHESHNELHQKHHEVGPRLEALKARLEEIQLHQRISPKIPTAEINQLNKRLEKLETKKVAIKEKIIKRITKKSKDYVKSIMLSYIKKYGKITALQLKEMVVEEQGLCSKSSFYRLLEELEEEPEIGVLKTGKEKHYIAKLSKKNY
jgi:tetrahydromethanopterin S-methyltransferase subunit G